MIYLAINFALYLSFFLYNLKSKFPGKYYSMLILGVFMVSAFCSLFYYNTELYKTLTESGGRSISLQALIYLFIGFCIFMRPLQKYPPIRNIQMPRMGKNDLLYIAFVFLGIVSIVPFFENLKQALLMSGQNMADVYFDRQGGTADVRSHLSSVGRFCNGIVSWFQFILPIAPFYLIQQKKRWYWIVLVTLGAVNPVLQGIIFGGRGALFQTFCVFAFNYILFKDSFAPKVRKRIIYVGSILLGIFVAVLVIMTIARASGDDDSALSGVFRYLGEGFVNFAESGWYIKNHTDGFSIFNGTGYTFLKDMSPYFEARDYVALENITHIRMYVYYTIMGDAFIDFNVFGGLFFLFILAQLFWICVKKHSNQFSSLILLNLYAKIGFNGIYCWAYMYYLDFVLFTLVIVFMMRSFENKTNTHQLTIQK